MSELLEACEELVGTLHPEWTWEEQRNMSRLLQWVATEKLEAMEVTQQ